MRSGQTGVKSVPKGFRPFWTVMVKVGQGAMKRSAPKAVARRD